MKSTFLFMLVVWKAQSKVMWLCDLISCRHCLASYHWNSFYFPWMSGRDKPFRGINSDFDSSNCRIFTEHIDIWHRTQWSRHSAKLKKWLKEIFLCPIHVYKCSAGMKTFIYSRVLQLVLPWKQEIWKVFLNFTKLSSQFLHDSHSPL